MVYNLINSEAEFNLFDKETEMELALTINPHPQSAFQLASSFHKQRLLLQLDDKLDSKNEHMQFDSPLVFEEER